MSASPINGAVGAPLVSATVAPAAASKRDSGGAARSSFGLLAEDPGNLQDFLRQNPEMAVRLKAQVEIAQKSPEAARNMQSKLGLGNSGMKNLCQACKFPDPAEQFALRSRSDRESRPKLSSANRKDSQSRVEELMQQILRTPNSPRATTSAKHTNESGS